MDVQKINQLLSDTAYIRTGGSPEELKCVQYLQSKCKEREVFSMTMPGRMLEECGAERKVRGSIFGE